MKLISVLSLLAYLLMSTSFKKKQHNVCRLKSCTASSDSNGPYMTRLVYDSANNVHAMLHLPLGINPWGWHLDRHNSDTTKYLFSDSARNVSYAYFTVVDAKNKIIAAGLTTKNQLSRLRRFTYDSIGQLRYSIGDHYRVEGEISFDGACRAFYRGDSYSEYRPEYIFQDFTFKDSTVYYWKDGDLIQQTSYICGSNNELCTTTYAYFNDRDAQTADPIQYSQILEYGIASIQTKHLLRSATYQRSSHQQYVSQYKYRFDRGHRITKVTQVLSGGIQTQYEFTYSCN